MKGFTVLIQFGWCGFGASAGLVPEIRLGLIRLAACRGWIIDALKYYRDTMARVNDALRRQG